jgi:hypothetical protein
MSVMGILKNGPPQTWRTGPTIPAVMPHIVLDIAPE